MNWKTFAAMLARDAHVARRNAIQLFLQTFLQPLLFVFIFGRVMVGSGFLPASYKSLLLPGIIAISMVYLDTFWAAGLSPRSSPQAVALPIFAIPIQVLLAKDTVARRIGAQETVTTSSPTPTAC